ncbi:MAG: hypothetical protein F7C35_08885 [Desulfurococcales archaeon]|nr:hypothetical protein [Desulfurococcales archaeon]
MECRPHRIHIARTSPPPRLIEELEEMGFNVTWSDEEDCSPDTLNFVKPGRPVRCRNTVDFIPHITVIPDFLRALEVAGEWCSPSIAHYFRAVMGRLDALKTGYRPAWSSGPLRPPERPPPLYIVAEVYYRGSADETLEHVNRAFSEGADAVSIGLEDPRLERGYLDTIRKVIEHYPNKPVLADPGSIEVMIEALKLGAHGGLSLTREQLHLVPEGLRASKAFVLIDFGGVEDLLAAARRATALGYRKIILDPIIYPPINPGTLGGLEAAGQLSRTWRGPIMLGLGNVYELIDADTTGTIPLLTSLAAEAGVSVLLVTEESPKAYGAVLEARVSADLISLALYYKTPPKDYPLRLLVAKVKTLDGNRL